MRDPGKTPEPVPAWEEPDADADHTGDEQDGRGDTFVVQEHHATALHWDVRLERDGVLVSWAVPKGLPLDPSTNHLAKQTEDHPMAYATFEGGIPKGEYGGGAVAVWDSGTYELQEWRPDKVKVVLHGRRVEGRYVFFRTGGRDWMVHRMGGPPPGWTPLPTGLRPMRATRGGLPAEDEGWSYDVDWSGEHVLVAVYGGRLTVTDDSAAVVTPSYPELRGLGLQLGSRQVLLHGELVVLEEHRRHPDADLLDKRVRSAKPGAALLRDAPVQLMVSDVLHLEGEALLDRGYDERRAALDELPIDGPNWLLSPAFPGGGRAVLDGASAQGLRGIVAKRRDSPYRPGRRSRDWLAVKAGS